MACLRPPRGLTSGAAPSGVPHTNRVQETSPMGPTNVALVKLFQADQQLREAQARLDAASKNVRIQDRRVHDAQEKVNAAQTRLRENQAKSHNLELDLKTRGAHIEKLRAQQQAAKNNKEYQAFLIEINTYKVDRGKVEDETMKVMEAVEKGQAELRELTSQLEGERAKLQQLKEQIGDRVAQLQSEIDALKPERDAAAAAVPPKALAAFDRLADHLDGEAMAAIARPDRRREEYLCTACNMDLVTDVYNKLHTRDELIFCPSCRRLLYIPEDLPVEAAVNKPKEPKAPRKEREPRAGGRGRGAGIGAAVGRQSSAIDVLRSMQPDDEEGTTQPAPPAASAASAAEATAPPEAPATSAPEPAPHDAQVSQDDAGTGASLDRSDAPAQEANNR
jgi:predicted  nucleic acid-binding Zn-ribbon protein